VYLPSGPLGPVIEGPPASIAKIAAVLRGEGVKVKTLQKPAPQPQTQAVDGFADVDAAAAKAQEMEALQANIDTTSSWLKDQRAAAVAAHAARAARASLLLKAKKAHAMREGAMREGAPTEFPPALRKKLAALNSRLGTEGYQP
jgi:hypothetical protein